MTPNPSRVSVIIPVKDDAGVLDLCLQLLALQSTPPLEVIVVDDGSSDGSGAVAARHGARVIPSRGTGIATARATGFDAATGDLLATLDADCRPPADWIEGITDGLRDPSIAAVTGGARFHDGPRPLRAVAAAVYLGSFFLWVTLALGHPPVFGSNYAMRASAWRAIRGEVHLDDELLHDDMDVSFHLGPDQRIRYSRGLQMSISMRPLFDARSFALRMRRGFHTVFLHWPSELPWSRWVRSTRLGRRIA